MTEGKGKRKPNAMSGWREGVWKRGKQTVKGVWRYVWASDRFVIELDSTDRITGQRREIVVYGGETPEWGNWKLQRP